MSEFLFISFMVYLGAGGLVFLLYAPRMVYFFYAFKKKKPLVNEYKNKLCVLVPARNESDIISECLDSLRGQTYDKDKFDIHIIVADPHDKTVGIAKKYENTFIHVVTEQTCKGAALDGAFREILEKPHKYDAYVIVDADGIVAPNFLEEMNNALSSGKQIICAKKMIKNWQNTNKKGARSWISNCTALTWTNVDEMGNKFRSHHGIPISIVGTGLLVRADVINDLGGWPYRTLTEDYELTMDCMIRGYTTMYYEHAHIFTEEALRHKTANKRRVRWIRGSVQCKKFYRERVKSKTFKRGKIVEAKNIDFLYGGFPIVMFAILTLAMTVFSIGAYVALMIIGDPAWWIALCLIFYPVVQLYVMLFFFTILTLLVVRQDMHVRLHEKFVVVFLNPWFIMEYLFIYIKALLTSDNYNWESIERIKNQDNKV